MAAESGGTVLRIAWGFFFSSWTIGRGVDGPRSLSNARCHRRSYPLPGTFPKCDDLIACHAAELFLAAVRPDHVDIVRPGR